METYEELKGRLEEINRQNEMLDLENAVLESYLERNDKEEQVDLNATTQSKKRGGKQRVKSLSYPQKLTIVTNELEYIKKKTEDTKRNSERYIDELVTRCEAHELRITEIKKEQFEFKRDIIISGEGDKTPAPVAEKFIRYMEEKLRQKDSLIDKIKLKNDSLKVKLKKSELNLKQKDEMGDVLHYIDFHQLQIENKQFTQKIDERNQELLKLKMTTGKTVLILNQLKTKLFELIKETEFLNKEIKLKSEQLDHAKKEHFSITKEINTRVPQNKQLLSNKEETKEMPNVFDYVLQKAEAQELKRVTRNWERKVEIAKMAVVKGAPV